MDYEKVRKELEDERAKGSFIFLPGPIMDMADSFYMPVVEIVVLRNDETYSAQGKHRIHYNGLLRLSSAACMEWSAIDTCRTDPMNHMDYCSFRAVGGVRKADGRIYFHKAEKDIDLRVVEQELEDQYSASWDKIGDKESFQWKKGGHKTKETYVAAMVRRDMLQKRKNKLTLVESGAKARVIRFVLGLQSQYSDEKKLLGMRFVMVHYALNPNHPKVGDFFSKGVTQSMNMVYGGGSSGALPAPRQSDSQEFDTIDIEPEQDEQETDLFDVNDLNDFQALSINDQEAWCKHHVEKYVQYSWEDMTGDLKGKTFSETAQLWRDGLFGYLIKARAMASKKTDPVPESSDDVPY